MMYRKYMKNKEFKVIPEAGLVQGEMDLKWYEKDMRHGFKPIYKRIIGAGMDVLYPWRLFPEFVEGGKEMNVVHANAYCDENDEFDEQTGIEVCSAKLEWKNHMKIARAYDRLHRILIETANIVAKLCMDHTEKAKAIEADLVREYGRMEV